MKKLHRALVAAVVACTMLVTPVFAAPTIDELKEKEAALEREKSAVEAEVSSLRSQLTSLMSKIEQLEIDMVAKGEEIAQAKKDLEAAQAKEEQQYHDMKIRIKYMYEEGDSSALERVLNSGSIAEMLSQAEYVKSVHEYDRDMLNEYIKIKEQVKLLKETLEEEMAALEEMQVEYEAQQKNLSATLASKQAEVADLDRQIQSAAAEAARLAEEQRQQAQQNQQGGDNNAQGGGESSSGESSNTTTQAPTVNEPANNTSAASAIVSAAYSQLGVPYVWGGTTPGVALDCSGLTQYCHRVAGIRIPRTSGAQLAGGKIVSNPQPGDICWTPGHVGIYIGGGQMIEAQQSGVPVCVSRARATYYVRYW